MSCLASLQKNNSMKTNALFLLLFSLLSYGARATSVLASSFGWNGQDDTQALYEAFTFQTDTLVVDLQAGDWVSGPLVFDGNVNDKVVIFENGLTLKALQGAYDDSPYNGLLSFINCANVTIIGYGAKLEMNKEEYIALNDGSEWRHVIALSACEHFKIFGLELSGGGGDGIEISGLWQQPVPSSGIHIKNCKIDNNYRQGISITSAQNILIEHCEITNTSGTPPAFGIDLEPDNPYDLISNIRISNCRISGNEGGGLLASFWNLDATSAPISVMVTDCYIASNENEGIVIDLNTPEEIEGYLRFERCLIEDQPGNAIFSDKRASVLLYFKNMAIRSVGTNGGTYDMPIFIQSPYDYPGDPLGNLQFQNILIDDRNHDRDFINISHWGSASQVENISGNFTVYNASGGNASFQIEGPQQDVDINVVSYSYVPYTAMYIDQYGDSIAYEQGSDTTAAFLLTRISNHYAYPLPVFLEQEGDALNRIDYNYQTGVLLLPPDSTEMHYSITAVSDQLEEGPENVKLQIAGDSLNYYIESPFNSEIELFIGGIPAGTPTKEISQSQKISISPNPVSGFTTISWNEANVQSLEIFDFSGRSIQQIPFSPTQNNISLNVQHLPKGVYVLRIRAIEGVSNKFLVVQ